MSLVITNLYRSCSPEESDPASGWETPGDSGRAGPDRGAVGRSSPQVRSGLIGHFSLQIVHTQFLNLPLGANFYNSTDLSHTTTTTTDFRTSTQPQLAVEAGWGLAYLAGPYWMTSTCGWGMLRQVEASWGKTTTAILLDWNSVVFWPS